MDEACSAVARRTWRGGPVALSLALAAAATAWGAAPEGDDPAAATPVMAAGWDDGRFFLASEDGRYRLNVGGWIQPRYEFRRTPDDEDTSRFRLRRVRLNLTGHVFDEALTYRVMPDFAGDAELFDAWANYAFDPLVQVRFGQFSVPFHWHFCVSANRQHFAERGLAGAQFGVPAGYDLGVLLHGQDEADRFAWGLGIFDGAARGTRPRDNTGHLVSTRVRWAPLGELIAEESDLAQSEQVKVTLAGGAQGAWRSELRAWDLGRSPAGNERGEFATGTVDAVLHWRGLSLVGEGYLRRVWPDDSAVDAYTGWAYSTGAGWFVLPRRVEVVGRFGQLMLDRDDGATRQREWAAGLNLYHRGHRWKTQASYIKYERDAGNEHVWIVQHQLWF